MNTWLTFFLLQLQCGTQQWGEVSLRYGTAVVISSEHSLPRVLTFQDLSYERDQSNHPWCETFSTVFNNEGTINVLISPVGEIVKLDL